MTLALALFGSLVLGGASAYLTNLSHKQVRTNEKYVMSITGKRLPLLLDLWSKSLPNIKESSKQNKSLMKCMETTGQCHAQNVSNLTLKRIDGVVLGNSSTGIEYNLLGEPCRQGTKKNPVLSLNKSTGNDKTSFGGEANSCMAFFRVKTYFSSECKNSEANCGIASNLFVHWKIERKKGNKFVAWKQNKVNVSFQGCGETEVMKGIEADGTLDCVDVAISQVVTPPPPAAAPPVTTAIALPTGVNYITATNPYGNNPACIANPLTPSDVPPHVGTASTPLKQLWPNVPTRYNSNNKSCRWADAVSLTATPTDKNYCAQMYQALSGSSPKGCHPRFDGLATRPNTVVCADWHDRRMVDGQVDFAIIQMWPTGDGRCGVELVGKRGATGCFAEGTEILTNSGNKPIETLSSSDKIFNPVTEKWQNIKRIVKGPEQKPLLKINLASKEIIVTSDHPMVTQNGLQPAHDVKVGDSLLVEKSKFSPVLHISFVKSQANVWNLEVDSEKHGEGYVNNMVLANGIAAGDLYLQENMKSISKKSNLSLNNFK